MKQMLKKKYCNLVAEKVWDYIEDFDVDQWDMATLCGITFDDLQHILGKRYRKVDILTLAAVSESIDVMFKEWDQVILGIQHDPHDHYLKIK